MRTSLLPRLFILNAIIMTTMGCEPPHGTTTPPTPEEQPPPTIPSKHDQEEDGAPKGTSVQSWGIGADWYIYGAGHSVRPKDQSWLIVRKDHTATHVRIDGFYSNSGVSSTPSMTLTPWADGAWQAPKVWMSPTRIRDEFQCLDLEQLDENHCEDTYDIVWRTDFRALPRAGFAISNPALYAETGRGEKVYELPSAERPISVDAALPTATRILSILDYDAEPLIHSRFFTQGYSVIQLTGDMSIAEWTLTETAEEITIHSRCTVALATPIATQSLTASPDSLSLLPPAEGQWTYVDLCNDAGPTVHAEFSGLKTGDWPSNNEFDLALQTVNGTLNIWPAPEGIFTPQRTPAFEEKRVPDVYWAD